jgi:hypothetical protein
MSESQGEARPNQELTNQGNTHLKKELGGTPKIVSKDIVPQEWRGWYEWPHERLVNGFRDFVQQREQQTEGYFSPEEIICSKLEWLGPPPNEQASDFVFRLQKAWDALAYDRYEPGSLQEHLAGATLQYYYHCTQEPAIKLSNPLQIRIVDALAEAAGIPHQKGQAEIKIPEKVRHYGTSASTCVSPKCKHLHDSNMLEN